VTGSRREPKGKAGVYSSHIPLRGHAQFAVKPGFPGENHPAIRGDCLCQYLELVAAADAFLDQDDNLVVLHGTRFVDIYAKAHGQVESFDVAPHQIRHGGKVVYDGAAMLVWPRGVFHLIRSDEKLGSASLNFAVRYDDFDIRTNFNVYDLDPISGEYRVIRAGYLDQPTG